MARRRIGGAGGGSDKGGGGGVLLAAALALALGVGGTSVAVGSGGASSGSSSGSSSSRGGERDVRAVEARLTGQRVRVTARVTDDTADCVGHAYGRVRDFLRERRCVALRRAQLEVRLPAGDVVLVAVSWVEMPDEHGARDLHRLVDGNGTGNVVELSRERGRYRAVRGYTGDVYASDRHGTVVVNAQAEPVARRAGGLALTALVNEAVR